MNRLRAPAAFTEATDGLSETTRSPHRGFATKVRARLVALRHLRRSDSLRADRYSLPCRFDFDAVQANLAGNDCSDLCLTGIDERDVFGSVGAEDLERCSKPIVKCRRSPSWLFRGSSLLIQHLYSPDSSKIFCQLRCLPNNDYRGTVGQHIFPGYLLYLLRGYCLDA